MSLPTFRPPGLIVLVVFVALANACDGGTEPVTVAGVAVSPPSGTVIVGEDMRLTATVTGSNGTALTGRVVSWSSSSPGTATVDATGLVTGLEPGQSTISATSESQSGTAAITVLRRPVFSIVIEPQNANVIAGQSIQLIATPRAADGTVLEGRTVAWTSSSASVASIDAVTGSVTGISAGSVVISAMAEGVTGQTAVQVLRRPVGSVVVTPASTSLTVGAEVQLEVQLLAADGTELSGRTVTWESSTASASVSAAGLVTGLSEGIATITARSEGVSGQASIEVLTALTGSWVGIVRIQSVNFTVLYTLVEENGTIVGSSSWLQGTTTVFSGGSQSVTGSRNGDAVSLTTQFTGFAPFTWAGSLTGPDSMEGTINGSGFVNLPLTLGRTSSSPVAPSQTAQRVEIAPGSRAFGGVLEAIAR